VHVVVFCFGSTSGRTRIVLVPSPYGTTLDSSSEDCACAGATDSMMVISGSWVVGFPSVCCFGLGVGGMH
jgi:hypothetical protein